MINEKEMNELTVMLKTADAISKDIRMNAILLLVKSEISCETFTVLNEMADAIDEQVIDSLVEVTATMIVALLKEVFGE